MADSQLERKERKRRERQALEFPLQPPAASGELVRVSDGVLWARMPMPGSLDHVNVYLLRDDDGWWLIDTGLNTQQSRDAWELIAAQRPDGLPFKALVCTHFHYDHAGLAHWLMERFGIPLYMSYGEYFTLRALASDKSPRIEDGQRGFYRQAGMPVGDIDAMFAALQASSHRSPCPQTFHRLQEGDALTIGSRRWQVIVGEGHSPEHVCLYAPEDGLLVAGDQLLPEISSNVMVSNVEPEADPLRRWLASLDRLATLSPDTRVLPSHGDVFGNVSARVEQLRNHHARQFEYLLALADQAPGFSAFEAMRCLFPQPLSATEKLMALGEAIAHLTRLRREGRLVRTSAAIDTFYRAGAVPKPA